jgi:hypothetical protein
MGFFGLFFKVSKARRIWGPLFVAFDASTL